MHVVQKTAIKLTCVQSSNYDNHLVLNNNEYFHGEWTSGELKGISTY